MKKQTLIYPRKDKLLPRSVTCPRECIAYSIATTNVAITTRVNTLGCAPLHCRYCCAFTCSLQDNFLRDILSVRFSLVHAVGSTACLRTRPSAAPKGMFCPLRCSIVRIFWHLLWRFGFRRPDTLPLWWGTRLHRRGRRFPLWNLPKPLPRAAGRELRRTDCCGRRGVRTQHVAVPAPG